MTGYTPRNVPYARGADPLVDYPPVSESVANLVRLSPFTPGGVLRAGAFDGEEIELDVTPGGGQSYVWRMRWVASKSVWVFLGGQDLWNYDASNVAPNVSPGWTTCPPSLVVPAPGRYIIGWGGEATGNAPGIYVSLGAVASGWAITSYFPPVTQMPTNGANQALVAERMAGITNPGGGWATINLQAQASAASPTGTQRRYLRARPLWLGAP